MLKQATLLQVDEAGGKDRTGGDCRPRKTELGAASNLRHPDRQGKG
jgi:hypothetical protein